MGKKKEKKSKQEQEVKVQVQEKPKPAPVRLVIQNGKLGSSSTIKQEQHNG